MKRFALALTMMVHACGGGDGSTVARPPSTSARNSVPVDQQSAAPLSVEEATAVGRSVNGFAADLFARLAVTPGDIAFSPASIEAALAMAAAGARGETATSMRSALRIDSDAAIDRVGRALVTWNDLTRTTYTLRVANRLFGADRYTFEQAYLDRTRSVFAAPLERLDFLGAPDVQRLHINAWIAEHTNDRIRDLLQPGSIRSDTRLVLVNAVYLAARWVEPFEHQRTGPGDFRLNDGTTVQVDTMHNRLRAQVGTIDGATVLDMPYEGGELVMRFVLPPEGTSPESWATEAHLTDVSPLERTEILLSLPKFRVETDAIRLENYLREMGMHTALSAGADFTGIATPPRPEDRVFLNAVIHQAFVNVDEQGTEAAAATAAFMEVIAPALPTEPREVRFDRPFLAILRDVRTNAILFLARISDPR